jgi:hypothetical protein
MPVSLNSMIEIILELRHRAVRKEKSLLLWSLDFGGGGGCNKQTQLQCKCQKEEHLE